ncbi:efflux RND transporter permease subunit [Parabacteroides sp. FAFU027]|uniref:efflux RND transporter permease subunit n=1 Tax=Parabacteroides sp. FAFU027 TaxID=2922715 RepID=UPI001FAFFF6D|nr:efflux RND transporter permease subunit [Parabacteroides sp. FAFU027]
MSRAKISVVELAMRHRQIVLLITAILLIFGVFALIKMPKQEFPSFTIRQGLVVGVYPGATSAEVEEQLAKPLERFLFSYKEIKKEKTYSQSRDGIVYVYVELNDNVKDKDEFWSKFKHGLSQFRAELPSGVLALIANDDFGDTSALLISLESKDKTYHQLENYLDELESRLRRIKSVSNLRHYGLQREQISIYLDKEKLAAYGISSSSLFANFYSHGITSVSGSVDNSQLVAPIHIPDTYRKEQDIANQIVYSDPKGNLIRLKDVARIVRGYPNPDSYVETNGNKCLILSMEMQQGNNIIAYGKEVDEVLKKFQAELPQSVTMKRIADQPKVVNTSVNNFLREMGIAILAVILVTIALLPLRVATVAATTIPISVFISMGIMFAFGIELNTVTLAALIVVLGMIVDNSIVIVDSYMEKLDHGMSRWYAAISSAREYFKAIFSATLAISITFFPFLITMSGQMNDFVLFFPWTILITLFVSLAVAMLLIPYMQYLFIRKGFIQLKKEKGSDKPSFLDKIQALYDQLLALVFRHPRVTLMISALCVVIGGLVISQSKQRLWPVAERDQFAVEIYLPQGSSLQQTVSICNDLEKTLRKESEVTAITKFVGTSSPRFHTTYAPNLPGKNYAQFIVNTSSEESTEELLDKYTNAYAYHYPKAYVKFKQMDFQAVSAPIEVRLSGDNIAQLKSSADSVIRQLRKINELVYIRTNYEQMLPGAEVDIDNVEANRLGLTRSLIAGNLAIRFNGLPITTLWEGDYPVAVKLKADWKDNEPKFSDIGNEHITSINPMVSVPLRQVAKIRPDWTDGQIVRRNGVRTLSVQAEVKRGYNTGEIFKKVQATVDQISLPASVEKNYGGAHEADEEAKPQIAGGLIIAIFVIFMILVFHFKKINMALIVLGSTVLSLFGAAIGLMVMNTELGMTAILGFVSLMGIIVRNGIIMFDYAEEIRLKHKLTAKDAAFEAGKRRMRPIFLTSAAASMGVVPMIISKSALWAPMGTVIFFGTLGSMFFIVTVLPLVYWGIFRKCDALILRK